MPPIISSALWSAAAAMALVAGAWLALARKPGDKAVGLIAAFGAGALLSAVSFELVEDAVTVGEPAYLALMLAAGSLIYFFADRMLSAGGGAQSATARGRALLLGAALDGVPESFILGLAIASGEGVSMAFFAAVLVSNLPEGMASTAEMSRDPDATAGRILGLWFAVVGVCALSGAFGAWMAVAGGASGAYAQALAAGALITMLIDDLVPEARERGGLLAGPIAVLGFALAFGLHQLGA